MEVSIRYSLEFAAKRRLSVFAFSGIVIDPFWAWTAILMNRQKKII
jgi:hypothetical protein